MRDWGGFRRRDPVGGCANGIPLKDSTLVPAEPMMVAAGEAIVTVGVPARLTGEATARARRKERSRIELMIGTDVALSSI